jgi:hypothetical protein
MRTTIVILTSVIALTVAGCGDDGDSGTELSSDQAAAARSVIDSAQEEGVALDEDCVNGIAAQLSDADAALAAEDDANELSPEGEALGLELLSCADDDALVDLFLAEIGAEGIDEDCAREALADFDLAEILRTSGETTEPPEGFVEALEPCVASGG